ncbi:hypothetical protein C7441_11090 [Pseudaminobacter salicylatoxidans]|uniref:Uncharacterized protein n=1 Tax=Pseudaminobacter salicylatoxidans TaxID=93369 RepID=A0A316C5D7_PSESE|nr:hypothetical protein [Pseudaminobacter salicylatoxidans]PWJ81558.1 hypothetical protein C7441_11090 [Pseudaminobacter salicylatoxidans]
MSASPILFQWMGDCFIPANPHQAKRADEIYVIGETYRLTEAADRSGESHRHYFAQIKECWLQLPEYHDRFPSTEHLRHYALIKAGYHDSHSVVLETPEDAVRVAAFMEPTDEFAVIVVHECTVTRFTAKSQSYRAMDRKTFQESKDRTLDVISKMIGVTRKELAKNAGMAA